MGPNLIQRAKGLSEELSEGYLSPKERLEITSINQGPREMEHADHPLPYQDILTGDLTYYYEPRGDFEPKRELKFEYREQSGLFTLWAVSTPPTLRDIISSINDAVSPDSKITRIREIDRMKLIQIFDEADQIHSAQFSGVSLSELPQEFSLSAVTGDEDSGSPRKLKITKATGKSELYDISSHPIREVKAVFKGDEDHDPIIVEYKKGEFMLPHADWGSYESVLQIIETELLR
jgi:hypothetical protein